MDYTIKKKLFYDFKQKKLIVKDKGFNMHDKEAWISIEANPSRKEDCFYLGEMTLGACGNFAHYVTEEERTCMRNPPSPSLPVLLKYFEKWNASSFL
jgi:hypothetical protein